MLSGRNGQTEARGILTPSNGLLLLFDRPMVPQFLLIILLASKAIEVAMIKTKSIQVVNIVRMSPPGTGELSQNVQ